MSQQLASAASRSNIRLLASAGLIAGFAGGLAEIIWVWLIAPLTGGDPVAVAQGVTETVFPALAGGTLGIVLGLVIHMVLAVALGLAVAIAVRRALPSLAGSWVEFGIVVAILAGVWTMNFMVVLPIVNPAFVGLLPLWASLISKLLFGVSAALAMQYVDE